VCIYIYIYIFIYIYIYTHTHTYIYIYISGQPLDRVREKAVSYARPCIPTLHIDGASSCATRHTHEKHILAKKSLLTQTRDTQHQTKLRARHKHMRNIFYQKKKSLLLRKHEIHSTRTPTTKLSYELGAKQMRNIVY